MLGLWPRWLEWTGQDCNLGISDHVGHLGVRKVLVDNDTLDERSVIERSTDFTVHFDEFEIDVFTC